jgi:hypothetical protein
MGRKNAKARVAVRIGEAVLNRWDSMILIVKIPPRARAVSGSQRRYRLSDHGTVVGVVRRLRRHPRYQRDEAPDEREQGEE